MAQNTLQYSILNGKDDTTWKKNHTQKFLTTTKFCLDLQNFVLANLVGKPDSLKPRCVKVGSP